MPPHPPKLHLPARAGGSTAEPSGDTSTSVGYGRPPATTRFKPGKSGNPRGRPKGARNKMPALNEERLKDIASHSDIRWRELMSEPVKDIGSASVWREHWIEDMGDAPLRDDHRQPFQEPHSCCLESRQAQCNCEFQFAVRKQRKRQMKPVGGFLLIGCRLGRQAKEMCHA